MSMKTIFVSIANYKDPEVHNTVNELITKQTGKNLVKICVLSQIDVDDTSFDALDNIPNVQHVKIDYKLAQGACWARAEIQNYYSGEDYFMQIDSHMLFAQDWDDKLIEDHTNALTYGRKAIITAYPVGYEFDEDNNRKIQRECPTRFTLEMKHKVPSAVAAFAEDMDFPEQEFFLSGNMFFTTGDFVENVPYDPELFFFGEEISLAIRAYTAGYFMFAPTKYVCAHLYNRSESNKKDRTLFWDKEEDDGRKIKWWMRDYTSKIKVYHICLGNWYGRYGIQDHDLYLEYAARIKVQHPNIDLKKVTL
jgi:hypothetical protein